MLNTVTQSHTACIEQIYEATSLTTQKGTMLKVHYNDNLKPYTRRATMLTTAKCI
jgi:hypothetical protein